MMFVNNPLFFLNIFQPQVRGYNVSWCFLQLPPLQSVSNFFSHGTTLPLDIFGLKEGFDHRITFVVMDKGLTLVFESICKGNLLVGEGHSSLRMDGRLALPVAVQNNLEISQLRCLSIKVFQVEM